MSSENHSPDADRLILNSQQVKQKIKRIAFEIYERNFEEKELIVAGIVDRGYQLAAKICDELNSISHFTYQDQSLKLIHISLEKFTAKLDEVHIDLDASALENKCIVIVDDVLNTGRTLAYSVQPFLYHKIKKLEIAVLVNRSHIQFPVSANYTGYELATTLQEHIRVILEPEQEAVYLK